MVFLCFIFSSSWKTCFLLPVNKKLTTYIRNMGSWFHVIWTVSHISELNPLWESGKWDESLLPSLPTHSSSSQGRKALLRTYLEGPSGQWSPTFLAPGTIFVEDSFSEDQGRGLGIIQAHYIDYALYLYYCYINSTSDHQALDSGGWEPLFRTSGSPHTLVIPRLQHLRTSTRTPYVISSLRSG